MKMKKIIAMISVLTMVLTFIAVPVIAEETTDNSIVTVDYSINKMGKDYVLEPIFKTNTIIEFDYDLSNVTDASTNPINIPIAVKSNGVELCRASIQESSLVFDVENPPKLIGTSMNGDVSGKACGFVGIKGTITLAVDLENKEITAKYTNGDFLKQETLLGTYAFSGEYDGTSGITALNLGASGSPVFSGQARIFSPATDAEFEAYKICASKYNFETGKTNYALRYDNGTDFCRSNAKGRESSVVYDAPSDNCYLKIPAGGTFAIMNGKPNFGYSGKTYVKYKQYIAGDAALIGNSTMTAKHWKANDQRTIAKVQFTGNQVKGVGNSTITYELPESSLKSWVEVMQVYDLEADTATLCIDGVNCGTINNFTDTDILSYVEFTFAENDTYIDDVEIGNFTGTVPEYIKKHYETLNISKGMATQNKKFNDTFTGNTVVEFDYDFSSGDFASGINIPFILLNNESEFARIAVNDVVKEGSDNFYNTRFEVQGNVIQAAAVAQKGKIVLLVDFKNHSVSAKYYGNNFKQEALLGTVSIDETITSLTGFKIGASQTPEMTVAVTAYEVDNFAEFTATKIKYDFETDKYTEGLDTATFDFGKDINKNSGARIGETNTNHYLIIPKAKVFEIKLNDINRGYSGVLYLKHKLYVNGDVPMTSGSYFEPQQYITGSTKEIDSVQFIGNTVRTYVSNDAMVQTQTIPTNLYNNWFEVMNVIDFDNHKVTTYIDGVRYGTLNIDSEMNLFNVIKYEFYENEVYIDDLEIGTFMDDMPVKAVTAKNSLTNKFEAAFSAGSIYDANNLGKSALIVLCTYAGNKLENVAFETVSYPIENKILGILDDGVSNDVKAFIWDGTSGLKPLMNPVVGFKVHR